MTEPMPVRFDAKGKYFTKVVSTQTLEIVMRLHSGESVRGHIHVRPEHRLSDMMNDETPFLSLTNAVVEMGGKVLYETSFICVNRREVQWVLPTQAIGEMDDESEENEHELATAPTA